MARGSTASATRPWSARAAASPPGGGRHGKVGEALGAARAIRCGRLVAAEPQHSAALTDLEFQVQVFHGIQSPYSGRHSGPHRFRWWKGGACETCVRRHGLSEGALNGSCGRLPARDDVVQKQSGPGGKVMQVPAAIRGSYIFLHCHL